MNTDDIKQLKNRFSELEMRCGHSDFLTLAQQDVLRQTGLSYELDGGYPEAERRMALFGGCKAPVTCVEISPLSKKFASDISHRDFLGALMGLSLRRELMGDIIVQDKTGYLFCLESIANVIVQDLTSVGRTSVKVDYGTPPPNGTYIPAESVTVTSSERLDAAVAAVFNLSRADSAAIILSERVMINGSVAAKASGTLTAGEIVSVRGFGRFKYEGISGETKKGRLRITIRKY